MGGKESEAIEEYTPLVLEEALAFVSKAKTFFFQRVNFLNGHFADDNANRESKLLKVT